MRKIFFIALACITAALAFYSCTKSSSGGDPGTGPVTGFDKTEMLKNYTDTIIIPAYSVMQQRIAALQTASDAFLNAPAAATQVTLKTAYESVYLQYERVAAFQFGPAETALLDIFLNFSGGLDYNFNTSGALTGFSIDSVTIENNISSGAYDLSSMTRSSFYAQGFPALNYLYFGPNAISKFGTNTTKRNKYVNDVVARMKTLVDNVTTGWTAYRTEFIANKKTNVGSPIGNLVNQFAYQMDLLKGPRIGWPFGKQSNGIIFASKCEGYFSGSSLALATENLTSLKNTYTGNTGRGIDDYLVYLNKTSLNNDVLAQFDAAISALRAIPNPLSASFTTNATSIDAAYKEIQKLLTLLKTDVASATAVQITFMDNDGD